MRCFTCEIDKLCLLELLSSILFLMYGRPINPQKKEDTSSRLYYIYDVHLYSNRPTRRENRSGFRVVGGRHLEHS